MIGTNGIMLKKEQVIGAVTTVEQWNHTQRCRLIERLLPLCSSYQLDMLWTVLQPSLHRDYFYAVKSRYPDYHFKRISTPDSRTFKEYRHRRFDGEESFYLSSVGDLREFRDDDGLPRKTQSVFTRSVDLSMSLVRKPRVSSRVTPKTARSVLSQWRDPSAGSSSVTSKSTGSQQLFHWFAHGWSESDQSDFLRRLIIKFDERQQYFISCVIMQRRYRDFISLLPGEIAFRILNYLTLPELSRSSRVCKHWKAIIDRERDLWKPKAKSNHSADSAQTDWEKLQKQRLAIKRNWMAGTARVIQCAGHTERVLCVCGNATHIATGSLDRKIKIWTLKDGKLCQTLVGHRKGVWSVRFLSAAIVISGAYDATIKIWNINTSVCLRTLVSHRGPVWSLACSNLFCLSGSQDQTARLWLLPTFELQATLSGHTSSVFGVDLNQEQDLCATSSADRTVRIWSLSTTRCLKMLSASTDDYIMSVSLQHGFIAYAFGVHIVIHRVNVTESHPCAVQKVMETQEHHGRIESVQLLLLNDDDKQPSLVSAGQDGLVKYWDLINVASQHTYNAQNDGSVKINCIHADAMHIVTASDDGLVKIFKFTLRKRET